MQEGPLHSRAGELLASYREGDQAAADELFEIFYPQLRKIASARMKGEKSGHSWQPTLLVNELYIELLKMRALPPENEKGGDRSEFLALAAWMMKRLLIHHSRPLSQKALKMPVAEESAFTAPGFESMAEMDEALDRLEGIRPRLRQIVELRVFEGLTGEEIAERLACGSATVTREWNFAKRWLQQELRPLAKA